MNALSSNLSFKLSLGLLVLSFLTAANGVQATGYIQDVQGERAQFFHEIPLTLDPLETPSLRERIFTTRLTQDLKNKYTETFGFSDRSVFDFDPANSATSMNSNIPSRQSEERLLVRQKYAEFTVKKIVEFHFENYFKSEPNLRPIYDAKERISKAEVQVANKTKLKLQYDFAGHSLRADLENPYLDTFRFVVDFSATSKTGETFQEYKTYIEKALQEQRRWRLETVRSNQEALLYFIHQPFKGWSVFYGAGQNQEKLSTEDSTKNTLARIGAQTSF